MARRRSSAEEADKSASVRVYPWDTFEDRPLRECSFELADIELVDPVKLSFPLVDAAIWDLCLRLHRRRDVTHLGNVEYLHIRRGEVNQTTYKKFITDNPQHATMLRGAQIAPYAEQPPSQGDVEWLDERSCLASLKRAATRADWSKLAKAKRIATQRITGVDDSRRLIALLVEPSPACYLADSTNSIDTDRGVDDLDYLLALLNSSLWQWRFRITSTNNNVQTADLEGLPFRLIDTSNDGDVAVFRSLVDDARDLRRLSARLIVAKGAARTAIERQCALLVDRIDQTVFALYGLQPDDLRLVADTSRVSGGAADDEE